MDLRPTSNEVARPKTGIQKARANLNQLGLLLFSQRPLKGILLRRACPFEPTRSGASSRYLWDDF